MAFLNETVKGTLYLLVLAIALAMAASIPFLIAHRDAAKAATAASPTAAPR